MNISYHNLENGYVPAWEIIKGTKPEVYSWKSGWIDYMQKPRVYLPSKEHILEIPEFELTGTASEVFSSLERIFFHRDGYYMVIERGIPFTYGDVFSLLIGIAYSPTFFIKELCMKPSQPINSSLPSWLHAIGKLYEDNQAV